MVQRVKPIEDIYQQKNDLLVVSLNSLA